MANKCSITVVDPAILAIAGLKLGAGRVVGVDIDPHTVESSIENAAQNQCDQNKAEFYLADFMSKADQTMDGWADVVVANILANPSDHTCSLADAY